MAKQIPMSSADITAAEIEVNDALEGLELERRQYFLVTMHRAENVDDPRRL